MKTSLFKVLLALTAGTLSCGAALAQAQEFKMGFVNTERIFREAATAKQAQAKLEQEFAKRERTWWMLATH